MIVATKMINPDTAPITTYEIVIEQLQTVYDPDFPMIDIYNMGLIYDVQTDDSTKEIIVTMTFTTPQCPQRDLIEHLVKFAINDRLPTYDVKLNIVRDPTRTFNMMKDEDLKRMFE